jgi:hypothetical protein
LIAAKPLTSRWMRFGKKLLIVVPLLLIGFFAVGRIRIHRLVTQHIAEARAHGYPTSGAEINTWLASVPDKENGAIVLTQAFGLLRTSSMAEARLLTNVNVLRTNVWSDQVRSVLSQYVETNEAALYEIGRALDYTQFRFPVDYSDGFSTLLPHLRDVKAAAIRLAFATALEADGNHVEKWPKLLARQVRLAEALDGEPTALGFLVRNALIKIAFLATQFALNQNGPKKEDCLILQKAFEHAAATNLLPNLVICERATVMPLFRMGYNDYMKMSREGGVPTGVDRGTNSGVLFPLIGFFSRDEIFYLRVMQMILDLARDPERDEVKMEQALIEIANEGKKSGLRISSMMLRSFAKVPGKNAVSQACLHMAALAFAIERYRIDNGELPDSLEDLTPEIIAEIPSDPFDGEDIRFLRLERGYRLYCVGADKNDDHGRVEPVRKKTLDTSTYDLTLTVER